MKEFQGKVAVVTGGASGIGRAMAERFAEEGMKIVLADVEREALAKAETEMRAEGAQVLAVPCDVSEERDVESLARRTIEAFDSVHILCNNAGVGITGRTWTISESDWRWVMGVNLWGVIYGLRRFVPLLLDNGADGHIVNTASMAGLTTGPSMAPYYVSKHGVVALSECVHYELQQLRANVGVSVLCPGWVQTLIADSDRNRPEGTVTESELDEFAQQFRQMARAGVEKGIDPKKVAEDVLSAIRERRFYVYPGGGWADMVKARFHAVLEGQAPVLSVPPEE